MKKLYVLVSKTDDGSFYLENRGCHDFILGTATKKKAGGNTFMHFVESGSHVIKGQSILKNCFFKTRHLTGTFQLKVSDSGLILSYFGEDASLVYQMVISESGMFSLSELKAKPLNKLEKTGLDSLFHKFPNRFNKQIKSFPSGIKSFPRKKGGWLLTDGVMSVKKENVNVTDASYIIQVYFKMVDNTPVTSFFYINLKEGFFEFDKLSSLLEEYLFMKPQELLDKAKGKKLVLTA